MSVFAKNESVSKRTDSYDIITMYLCDFCHYYLILSRLSRDVINLNIPVVAFQ